MKNDSAPCTLPNAEAVCIMRAELDLLGEIGRRHQDVGKITEACE